MKYEEITGEIIGCAMKVHSWFGMGFPEIIYQRSLIIEIGKLGLECGVGIEKDLFYEGHFVGRRKLDLIIEGKVLVELKAVSEVEKKYYNQVINYLKVFDLEIGLLLNFGADSL